MHDVGIKLITILVTFQKMAIKTFCYDVWDQNTRVPGLSCGFSMILIFAVLIQCRHVTRHTHRQTHKDSIYYASIVSCNKTLMKSAHFKHFIPKMLNIHGIPRNCFCYNLCDCVVLHLFFGADVVQTEVKYSLSVILLYYKVFKRPHKNNCLDGDCPPSFFSVHGLSISDKWFRAHSLPQPVDYSIKHSCLQWKLMFLGVFSVRFPCTLT